MTTTPASHPPATCRCLPLLATPLCAGALVYMYVVPLVAGPSFWLIAIGTAMIGVGLSASDARPTAPPPGQDPAGAHRELPRAAGVILPPQTLC